METRFRYNPDVRSLPAMVPAVIPLLLLMMPAMLTALAVVREKELGSIINLYVTPVTRLEFLLGKQAPYVALAMLNFLLMALLAVTVFGVPVTGSFATLLLAALIYNVVATAIGLLASTFTRSQIAALFFTMIGTLVPAVQFAGLLTPVALAGRPGQADRPGLPGHAHAHHQPWRLQQGAGPVQPAVLVLAAAGGHTGGAGRVGAAAAQTGALKCGTGPISGDWA